MGDVFITRKELIDVLLKHGDDNTLVLRGDESYDRLSVDSVQLDTIQPCSDKKIMVPYIVIDWKAAGK